MYFLLHELQEVRPNLYSPVTNFLNQRSLMKLLILGLPVILLLNSCGKTTSTIKVEEKVFPTTYSNEPILLQKQSLNCRDNGPLTGNNDFRLHLFMEGRWTTDTRDFSPLLQGIFLKNNQVISKSVYGEKVEVIFSSEGARYTTRVEAKNILICPEESYRRETVESAALNTSYFINKTHLRFSSLFPDLNITPITLNISPEILRSTLIKNYVGDIIKTTSYMTDNAFYMPATSNVTFLPHSRERKAEGLELNYWEVPMVASHEYGHHLFQMIYKSEALRSPHMHNCFGTLRKSLSEKNRFGRKVTIDDVINSYNEGFADLVSWYTLDPVERKVNGVKCLETSRDIGSAKFYNGKSKVLSQEVLRSFFSPYPLSTNGTCEDSSYQETHVLGAVFAYTADRFLSKLNYSDDEKLQILVEWVKYLKNERKKYLLASPEDYLKSTISGFIKISLDKHGKNFDRKICSQIRMLYPDFNLKECSFI